MLKFLFNNAKCPHNKIYPFNDGLFCPDCGQEIKILWRILRCNSCHAKRKSHFSDNSFVLLRFLAENFRGGSAYTNINKIVPEEKFCKKCGSQEYYIDIKEKIEFFDYDYAIILKEEANTDLNIKKTLQIWIEEENLQNVLRKPELLPIF